MRIETQLVGEHWVPAVLGAMGCALSVGLTLDDCAAALPSVEPVLGRLSVHPLPSGVTVLRDEHNASMSVVGPALAVLRQVRSGRRVVVMGDVFDTPLKRRERFMEQARLAAESADLAVFVGEKSNVGSRAAIEAGMREGATRSFAKLEKAVDWLRSELRSGDVLLIRGRGEFHMERLYFGIQGSVGCWMSRCSIFAPCDVCEHLRFQMDLVRPEQILPLSRSTKDSPENSAAGI